MPKKGGGIALWLKPAESGRGRRAVWIIRDGQKRISTGCGAADRAKAEEKLAAYIIDRYRPERKNNRHSSTIPVADVINIYAQEKADTVARPVELGQRIDALLNFFGTKMLSQVTSATCREYADKRTSPAMARRELEDLRAAINSYFEDDQASAPKFRIPLPTKSQPRERWLTRKEAARFLWSLWRYREVQKGKPTGRHSRRHVARFVLIALYTGSRAGAICNAASIPTIGRGLVDLDQGVFYRRADGEKATKKRKPTIRLPQRLLAHMRRWERLGLSKKAIIEFNGEPVGRINKAFKAGAKAAGLDGLIPHMMRHTAVTWALQAGATKWDVCGYFGLTMETLDRVYGHHAPDHQGSVLDAFDKRASR